MKKINAYEKIQLGMKRNEKEVLWFIKKHFTLHSTYPRGLSWIKATNRLIEKKKIKYSGANRGYVLVTK